MPRRSHIPPEKEECCKEFLCAEDRIESDVEGIDKGGSLHRHGLGEGGESVKILKRAVSPSLECLFITVAIPEGVSVFRDQIGLPENPGGDKSADMVAGVFDGTCLINGASRLIVVRGMGVVTVHRNKINVFPDERVPQAFAHVEIADESLVSEIGKRFFIPVEQFRFLSGDEFGDVIPEAGCCMAVAQFENRNPVEGGQFLIFIFPCAVQAGDRVVLLFQEGAPCREGGGEIPLAKESELLFVVTDDHREDRILRKSCSGIGIAMRQQLFESVVPVRPDCRAEINVKFEISFVRGIVRIARCVADLAFHGVQIDVDAVFLQLEDQIIKAVEKIGVERSFFLIPGQGKVDSVKTDHVVAVEMKLADIVAYLLFRFDFRWNRTAAEKRVEPVGGAEKADCFSRTLFKLQMSALSDDDSSEFPGFVRRIQKGAVQGRSLQNPLTPDGKSFPFSSRLCDEFPFFREGILLFGNRSGKEQPDRTFHAVTEFDCLQFAEGVIQPEARCVDSADSESGCCPVCRRISVFQFFRVHPVAGVPARLEIQNLILSVFPGHFNHTEQFVSFAIAECMQQIEPSAFCFGCFQIQNGGIQSVFEVGGAENENAFSLVFPRRNDSKGDVCECAVPITETGSIFFRSLIGPSPFAIAGRGIRKSHVRRGGEIENGVTDFQLQISVADCPGGGLEPQDQPDGFQIRRQIGRAHNRVPFPSAMREIAARIDPAF